MLYAITSYFNPCGYRRRLETYRIFREHLTVPLITVELGFDGRFDLGEGDADLLVSLDDGDIMFQKERLLNIAATHLPSDCTAIAWLDCDVIFENPRWGELAREKLETAHIVQLFGTLYRLEQSDPLSFERCRKDQPPHDSLVKRFKSGRLDPTEWKTTEGSKITVRGGIAWAARREFFERVGLYDACVVGSGVKAFACALLGHPDVTIDYLQMHSEFERHYRTWTARLYAEFPLEIDWIETELIQLWHGDYAQRRYIDRHAGFSKFDYSPERDLAAGKSGCWKWTRPDCEMATYVKDYFQMRKEDGLELPVAAHIA